MNPYRLGLDPIVPIMEPLGSRVLLRAVYQFDGSNLALDDQDARKALCHEVIKVGSAVSRVQPGDMVVHISAAGDLLDQADESSRWAIVHEEDIVVRWSGAKALELAEKRQA